MDAGVEVEAFDGTQIDSWDLGHVDLVEFPVATRIWWRCPSDSLSGAIRRQLLDVPGKTVRISS